LTLSKNLTNIYGLLKEKNKKDSSQKEIDEAIERLDDEIFQIKKNDKASKQWMILMKRKRKRGIDITILDTVNTNKSAGLFIHKMCVASIWKATVRAANA
jgi:hypothetical protein